MRILILAALAAALTLAGPSAADNPGLVAIVGPGYNISLQDGSGNAVQHADPGTYTLVVHDRSDIHDFHLTGPGVDVATGIEFVGDQTFTVTLQEGHYQFVCDAHIGTMVGTFVAGSPPSPPPVPKPVVHSLSAHVGPGRTLSFPKVLSAGRYVIRVRDSSSRENVHLRGAGVDRKTGVAFTGAVSWHVALRAGTYRVWSDAHPAAVRVVTVRERT
jgi:hypothetical protein